MPAQADDITLLRDVAITVGDGRDADPRPIEGGVRKLTITFEHDACGVADLELLGADGVPVHVQFNVYGDFTVEGNYRVMGSAVDESAREVVVAALDGRVALATLPR